VAPPKPAKPTRTYVLLAVLVFLLFVLFGGPLRGLLHKRALVRVATVDAATGPLPHAPIPAASSSAAKAAAKAAPAFMEPSVQSLQVGPMTRRYVEIDPSVTSRDGLRALVLVFHGDGGSAESFHSAIPYERTSQGDAVVVYPDGLGSTWTLGGADPNQDLRFVDALVAKMIARGGVDPHRVFAFGYSSGGFLANLIACRHPGLLRAFASNAGGAPYDQKLAYANGFPKCEGEQPTAAMILHGDQDFGVTLDSGEFSASYWAYVNGCNEHERETTGYAECQAYRGCPRATPVVWCEIGDLGHWVWSAGAEASWQFFKSLP
jgi:polyhydroxybutyrate depolymerase